MKLTYRIPRARDTASRTRAMQPVGQGLSALLDSLGAGSPVARLTQLWKNWDHVMGPDLAELAFPLGHRRSTLVVGGSDNLALQELSFQTEEILERANAFMDEPFFERVELQLALGRMPLGHTAGIQPSTRKRPEPEKPAGLTGSFRDFDPDSAVGRAYLACLRMHGLR
ncbi:MAG TPA: DUF721 domain-containing protein [Candidatus Avidesulfovibrio excrementigallinarum]|nr:DUF721 domain-containing protein [Candidatus Avidesulfovibrio excrementigallinarum]